VESKVQLLSVESTPEFMQLPLEFQGFCPWTIVHRHGLLLPGNPALGVAKYRDRCFVLVSAAALRAFMKDPERYVEGVMETVRAQPQLIPLLRLQEMFPGMAITGPLGIRKASRDGHPLLSDPAPRMVDAATETPTHFVERHIDPLYEWNEWALRRRALQFANLRQAATTSVQTDGSHFRREGASQVYLPRDRETMTGISRGTNPPRVRTFMTGLRGAPLVPPKEGEKRAEVPMRVVTLTYEL
jgi:hypothetical protein